MDFVNWNYYNTFTLKISKEKARINEIKKNRNFNIGKQIELYLKVVNIIIMVEKFKNYRKLKTI
jgi:hypothetical protein